MNRLVVISGCSGGGKSTLLAELCARGYAVVEEPGRRIIQQERNGDGAALPWVDGARFARRAMSMALADIASAPERLDWIFFDRGVVDAATSLQHITAEPVLTTIVEPRLYHRQVFLTPPWSEIYVMDADRQHNFEAATTEYARLLEAYAMLGYDLCLLPKVDIAARADYVLATLKR